MIVVPSEAGLSISPSRRSWGDKPPALVSNYDALARPSRRLVEELRDEGDYPLPLWDDLWLTVSPPRSDLFWRVEAQDCLLGVVGRDKTPEEAVTDWRRRFRTMFQVFLAMRPFEMSPEEQDQWKRVQAVIDIPNYKASKPLIVRQVGKVLKLHTEDDQTLVEWEDGAKERVDPALFDELFCRFRVGQTFEATITRQSGSFRLLRADGVRKLPRNARFQQDSDELWTQTVGEQKQPESTGRSELNEEFWLKPTE